MKTTTTYIPADYRLDYFYREGSGPLIILLHGYGQTAQGFFSEVEKIIPKDCALLVPNGIFPLPGKARTIESLGFAWYFYDSQSDQYYIPYSIPSSLIQKLIIQLGLEQKEKIVVGYSQGGYLAPFVAQTLTLMKHVVCINSSFRTDLMQKSSSKYLVHGINGEIDDLVDPQQAKIKHDGLKNLERQGDFHLVPDTHHRINEAILKILESYLR